MRSAFSTSRRSLVTLLGGLTLAVAACSSSGGASPAPTTAASPAGPAEVTVAVANGAAGAYLTGRDGMTLYIFTPDSANGSTCVDGCAAAWPPFTIGADRTPNPGTGVTGTFTTFARPDGTTQVAYNGAPLYYYAADTKAGDTTGQGVGGKWFIASPTGTGPRPAASPSAKGKYGY